MRARGWDKRARNETDGRFLILERMAKHSQNCAFAIRNWSIAPRRLNSHFHAKKNGGRGFCASKILTRPVPRHNSPLGVNTAKKTKTMHIPGAVDEIRAALE